jgi:hypothetical protein
VFVELMAAFFFELVTLQLVSVNIIDINTVINLAKALVLVKSEQIIKVK